ncbi:MAG TPA: hypothetical protein VGX50_05645, partial [Longimicrobium sp.]|nr:hypothetical protein [Longimicrobium sp.]
MRFSRGEFIRSLPRLACCRLGAYPGRGYRPRRRTLRFPSREFIRRWGIAEIEDTDISFAPHG